MGVVLLGTVLGLSACGGSSDSSGSSNTNAGVTPPSTKPPAMTPPTNNKGTCVITSNNEIFVNAKGCTYASAGFNNGALLTYTCNGGRISNGIINSQTINVNGIKIQCAAA